MTTNVNGLSINNNNTRIDGASDTYTWLPANVAYIPSSDAIESVNVVTNNFDAEQGLAGGTPGSPPSFVAMAHFTFESVEAFQAAFAAHAAEIMADISNYTSIEPIIQISDIKLAQ